MESRNLIVYILSPLEFDEKNDGISDDKASCQCQRRQKRQKGAQRGETNDENHRSKIAAKTKRG